MNFLKKGLILENDRWLKIYNWVVLSTFVFLVIGGLVFAYVDATSSSTVLINGEFHNLYGVLKLRSGFLVWLIWIFLTIFLSLNYLVIQKLLISYISNVITIKLKLQNIDKKIENEILKGSSEKNPNHKEHMKNLIKELTDLGLFSSENADLQLKKLKDEVTTHG